MKPPKQPMLFPTEETHYGPRPNAGLPTRQRQALCGIVFALNGSDAEITALGSSNLTNVTCARCLELSKP
jgi:hypothetical protein